MRKYLISIMTFLLLLPSAAQTEVDGAWLAPSKPGWWFVLMDGINPSSMDDSIGMSFLRPGNDTWEMYFGPKTGPDSAVLYPWLSKSNMRATWTANTTDGTLKVESCTSGDCPFNTGESVSFEKVFGDGIDPTGGGGGNPPPDTSDVCQRDLCANNDTLAQECQDFLEACLLVEDEDECVGGALLKCS